ncbi:MAG: coiled coil domain-containing protein [Gammaproteobacteria bacterium]|nr:coiled coil domain-containing protein [Gammaproteobacteria bacterium]
MHLKAIYEKKMQPRLDEIKEEIDELRQKADEAETNLELEYYTLLEELQVKFEAANQKFQLLIQANEDDWEDFKSEFETIWDSLRELVKTVTSP